MKGIRLDSFLVERGLVESRARAAAIIMSGNVFVGGNRSSKPGMRINHDADVEIRGEKPRYVSRGGLKLERALEFFGVKPAGRVCIDCGASTGGFTDCLLQNGAKLVYAVDVGYGQLAWNVRNDPRVVTMERTNIRHVTREMFEPRPQLAVVDVSFISLRLVLPVLRAILAEDGEAVCLIKPQFEAGRENVGKKGVVRDPETHKDVLDAFLNDADLSGFYAAGLTFSPVKGPEGNIEFLGFLRCRGAHGILDVNAVVLESHAELKER